MDIIVTIPKSEDFNEWLKECRAVGRDKNARLNYYIGNSPLPGKTKPGERCYVAHNGFVRGYHIIDELTYREGFVCETTGREWPAGNYIIRKGKYHHIKPVKMRGFPGWKYKRGDF